MDDITQGLPRVEELFEARKPKGLAIIAEGAGAGQQSRDTEEEARGYRHQQRDGREQRTYLIPLRLTYQG